MANANSTPIHTPLDRIKVSEYWWGKLYRGSEAAFVAAGLIKPEWFPGKPGNAKTSVRVGMLDGEMKVLPYLAVSESVRKKYTIKISRSGKFNFEVWVRLSEEEKDRRDLKEKIEKVYKDKAKKMAELPTDSKDYVQKNLRTIRSMTSVMRESLTNNFGYTGGYSFSSDLIAEFDILTDHLIEVVKEGHISFDPEKRQRELAKIEDEIMAQHPEFSAFMKTTLAVGKAAL